MALKRIGFLMLLFSPLLLKAQLQADSSLKVAGSEYRLTGFQQMIKGTNYRKEWTQPVKVVQFSLKQASRIKPILNEPKRKVLFAEINGRRYILKTPDRSFPKVIDLDIKGTFIESLMNDKVSAFYPYAESVVSSLADAAQLFNTDCKYAFLSNSALPDSLQRDFSNRIYAVESLRDQSNISEYLSSYIETDSLIALKLDGSDLRIDERTYLRSKIFDIWVNDWKTEDAQIKWIKKPGSNLLSPVSINRDRSFFFYDGAIFKILLGVARLNYIQPFQPEIDEQKTFQIAAENNDRFFTTSLTESDWLQTGNELQQVLTDERIEASLKNLPSEIYPLSAKKLSEKLRSRRNKISAFTADYYHYLSKEIDIPGSMKDETFFIVQLNDSSTTVLIKQQDRIVFQNTFSSRITKQLRVYGIDGENKFEVHTRPGNSTEIKIIGGRGLDSVTHTGKGSITVFDNRENFLNLNYRDKKKLSSDTAINRFSYKEFSYRKSAFIPSGFYSNEDQLYLSAGYQIRNFKWRRSPYASNHLLELHYSLMDNGFSVTYKGIINQLIGRANLALLANYDQIRWTPFFGLGNDAEQKDLPIEYYRTRTNEWNASAIIYQTFGKHNLSLGANYHSIRILKDENRFLYKEFAGNDPSVFQRKYWAGVRLEYGYKIVNDSIVPTKGFIVHAAASVNKNIQPNGGYFQKYSLSLSGIVPLTSRLSFATTAGSNTLTGNAYFFQYPFIGGPTLRGYIRNRFWGKTVYYNNNDLRYITDFRSRLFNGKAGAFLFFDNGRVWMTQNRSNELHYGYGIGIIAVPFNKILLNSTLGFSKEGTVIQFKAIQYF